MNPVPFLMRFVSGWPAIQAEINNFAVRRGLPTFNREPKRYRFHGWGTVGFPPQLACNITYFHGPDASNGVPLDLNKRFYGQGYVFPNDALLAVWGNGDLATINQQLHPSLAEAKAALNEQADALGVFDYATGLYWAAPPREFTSVEQGPHARREKLRLVLGALGHRAIAYGGALDDEF
ncbi:MAG: hypothetical protein KME14_20410 [Tildeniella torsiva UHER 1998/13D]|jgi:hypothetical protein|nr:hypothetical protein [Tildeniella torsiva UHER 1998/13D]